MFVLVCVLIAINLAVIYCDDSSMVVMKDGDVRIAVLSSSTTALQPTGSMVALTDTENVTININDNDSLSTDGQIHISVDIAIEMSSFTKADQFYVTIYSANELVICEGRFGQLSSVAVADRIQCTQQQQQQSNFLKEGDNEFRIVITSWPHRDVVLLDTLTHCTYNPTAGEEHILDEGEYWLINDRFKEVMVAIGGGGGALFAFAILRRRWRTAPIASPSLAIDVSSIGSDSSSDDPKQGRRGDWDDFMDYYSSYPYSNNNSNSYNNNKVFHKLVAFTLGVLPVFLSSAPGRVASSSSSLSSSSSSITTATATATTVGNSRVSSSIIGSAGIIPTSPAASMWMRSPTDRRRGRESL